MISIEQLATALKRAKSVAIFCHVRPDGDTIGSSVAVALAIKKLGKTAAVFCADEIPQKFEIICGVNEIKTALDDSYDIYLACDVSDSNLLGDLAPVFLSKKETYCLDHHVSNTYYANNTCMIDTSSNAENAFKLIRAMGVVIDKDIADALLVGICTDTGNFTHQDVLPECLNIASELMASGADLHKINYYMYERQTKERAALFGKVMSKIRYYLDGKVGVISVSKEDFASTSAVKSDTEGFINFVLNVDTVEVAVSLMEVKDKSYKISFRSKRADVNEIAGVFGGGGHKFASGCMLNGYLEDVIDKVVFAVSTRLPE